MKALIKASICGWTVARRCLEPRRLLADGFKNCTKVAEGVVEAGERGRGRRQGRPGYEVRKSKIEGSCYEVYGVKDGKLFELFYSPEDLEPEAHQGEVTRRRPLSDLHDDNLVAGAGRRAGDGAGVGFAAAAVVTGRWRRRC